MRALALLLFLQTGCAGQQSRETVPVGNLQESVDLLTEELEALDAPPAQDLGLPVPAPEPVAYHAGVDYADMGWYPYDMTEFTRRVQELARQRIWRRRGGVPVALSAVCLLATMGQLAWIEYYADVNSQELYDACQTLDGQANTALDSLRTALSQVLARASGRGILRGLAGG